MATIKSYTDISQSKTLSKILPLESADMHYKVNRFNNESTIFIIPYSELGKYKDDEYRYCVCAWSLAALLSVLPTIDDEFEPQIHRSLDRYRCTYEGEEDSSGLWRVADNPVDACYEMIIKLHELNLL